MRDSDSTIPRRIDRTRHTPAERAITDAMQAVEELPADLRLTQAVILLGDARDRVADYVDGVRACGFADRLYDAGREITALTARVKQAERERDEALEHIGSTLFPGLSDNDVRGHAESSLTSDFWRSVARAELMRRARSSSRAESLA